MANYYFLKLHFDLLDDWKVGTLPDSLKWRFIQCLLVAGEQQENGFLPLIQPFAYRIRPMTPDALENDLSHLARAGLVELRVDDDGQERWFVTNFAKRQKRISNKDRQAAWRERQRNAELNDNNGHNNERVTYRYADRDIDRDIDKIEIESEIEIRLTSALSSVVKETFGPGIRENKLNTALGWLVRNEITPEQVEAFGAWWADNGWHNDKPALTNLMDHWPDFEAGKSLRKGKKTDVRDEVYAAIQNAEIPEI